MVERDLLEWLASLKHGQDGYGNEGDRAESGDQLSDEDESDEDEITHAAPFMLYHSCCTIQITNIIWNRHTLLFMDKIYR